MLGQLVEAAATGSRALNGGSGGAGGAVGGVLFVVFLATLARALGGAGVPSFTMPHAPSLREVHRDLGLLAGACDIPVPGMCAELHAAAERLDAGDCAGALALLVRPHPIGPALGRSWDAFLFRRGQLTGELRDLCNERQVPAAAPPDPRAIRDSPSTTRDTTPP